MIEVRNSPRTARKPQQRSVAFQSDILAIAAEYERLTVRQLYYQLVSRGVIEKTEQAYQRVSKHAAQLRMSGALSWEKIVDEHLDRHIAYQLDGLADLLESVQEGYRRDYWTHQPYHVEVWCEKAALSGIMRPICDEYGVHFVALSGFASQTIIYETARHISRKGKPAILLYFGDHDASGRAVSEAIERAFPLHGADVEIRRIALTPEHVEEYHLPTRRGKKSDPRQEKFAAEFGSASVELDALPPDVLEEMVVAAISALIDNDEWERIRRIEEAERETLEGWTHLLHPNDDDD